MSSSRALCCSPTVKKQKHDFQVCFVDRADYVKEKKLSEPEEKKELTQTALKTFILCRSEKERIRSMYNKTISKGYQRQPSASADNPYLDLDYSEYHKKKPHPIIVYNFLAISV